MCIVAEVRENSYAYIVGMPPNMGDNEYIMGQPGGPRGDNYCLVMVK